MLGTGSVDGHYASVGASALAIVQACLLLAGPKPPSSILDFASASGRVTRWLSAAYPDADLHVSDVRADSLAFCADAFGATAWESHADLAAIAAPRTFDLIWCGSLATHLPEADTKVLLQRFHDWLVPGGIAVVTFHGRRALEYMRDRRVNYGITAEDELPVLASVAARGYGYAPYAGRPVGFSVNSLQWLLSEAMSLDVRILCISEHAWDDHQDVIAFQRTTL